MARKARRPPTAETEAGVAAAVDEAVFREAIAHFATGVTVVTTKLGDRPSGMTASAVASVSLDPVLLLVCINNLLPAHEAIEGSRRFVVNVLGEGQEELALHFARSSPDKFAGIALKPDQELPVLEDAIAHFVCDVHERFPGGDHSIFIGLVRSCAAVPGRRPLVYFRSGFGSIRDLQAEELDEAALWHAGSAGGLGSAQVGPKPR
jgi:flavin reductase (DIM6/NTAB) family NADH-FMN oxidoreductase RutF